MTMRVEKGNIVYKSVVDIIEDKKMPPTRQSRKLTVTLIEQCSRERKLGV